MIEDDDDDRPHLRPWLAAMYVKPEYRKLGIASKLIIELKNEAKKLNEKELFLGTEIPDFYSRFRAEIYEKTDTDLCIMRISLNDYL